jgi:ribonuclease HII
MQLSQENACGVDEAGRGSLIGRVYTAAVVLPKEFPDDTYMQIKDSKKLSKKKRDLMRKYIEENAVAYTVSYSEIDEIDDKNILHATMNSMHRSLNNMHAKYGKVFDKIDVDGNYWKEFRLEEECVPYELVTKGDDKYYHIAAASILAKTYRDEYIQTLCEQYPLWEKAYGWSTNAGYGTKKHLDGLHNIGKTVLHRSSFAPCRTMTMQNTTDLHN